MKLLEDKILSEGKIGAGDVLKVDCFLNHRIDVAFLSELGKEFYRLYKDEGINKILTIEASGIGIACLTAVHFGCPVVFAKKTKTNNIYADVYTAEVYSYTHQQTYDIAVSSDYITSEDTVLIVDDFLAKGNALTGLIEIVNEAGAKLAGCAIAIEKGFQGGGDKLRAEGIRVESLAIIDKMTDDSLEFRQQA